MGYPGDTAHRIFEGYVDRSRALGQCGGLSASREDIEVGVMYDGLAKRWANEVEDEERMVVEDATLETCESSPVDSLSTSKF